MNFFLFGLHFGFHPVPSFTADYGGGGPLARTRLARRSRARAPGARTATAAIVHLYIYSEQLIETRHARHAGPPTATASFVDSNFHER